MSRCAMIGKDNTRRERCGKYELKREKVLDIGPVVEVI